MEWQDSDALLFILLKKSSVIIRMCLNIMMGIDKLMAELWQEFITLLKGKFSPSTN